MSFSAEDPSVFVVGTESGLVLKCSTLSTELPLDKGDISFTYILVFCQKICM